MKFKVIWALNYCHVDSPLAALFPPDTIVEMEFVQRTPEVEALEAAYVPNVEVFGSKEWAIWTDLMYLIKNNPIVRFGLVGEPKTMIAGFDLFREKTEPYTKPYFETI